MYLLLKTSFFSTLLYLFQTLHFTSGVLYNGLHFDFKDRMNAECVRRNNFLDYEYLGNKDYALNRQDCLSWREVTESWFGSATDDQKSYLTTVETMHHSKCRNVKLHKKHPYYMITESGIPTNSTVTSGSFGPWCFIKSPGKIDEQQFDFLPSPCFKACNETKIVVPQLKKKHAELGFSHMKLNYNKNLLDPVERLFSKYDRGDEKYYEFKPSNIRPPDFYELRKKVFYTLCAIFLVVIVWIFSCYCLRKRAKTLHRAREKALENFYDTTSLADIRMRVEIEREASSA